MNKRIRKKRRVNEFAVLQFTVTADVPSSEDVDVLGRIEWDRIEVRGLLAGGMLAPQLDVFVFACPGCGRRVRPRRCLGRRTSDADREFMLGLLQQFGYTNVVVSSLSAIRW